jgi:hypothetical protein
MVREKKFHETKAFDSNFFKSSVLPLAKGNPNPVIKELKTAAITNDWQS